MMEQYLVLVCQHGLEFLLRPSYTKQHVASAQQLVAKNRKPLYFQQQVASCMGGGGGGGFSNDFTIVLAQFIHVV